MKCVFTECESRVKARIKEVDSVHPHTHKVVYDPTKNTENFVMREFLTMLREKLIKDDILQVREWTRMNKVMLPPPRPMGPTAGTKRVVWRVERGWGCNDAWEFGCCFLSLGRAPGADRSGPAKPFNPYARVA